METFAELVSTTGEFPAVSVDIPPTQELTDLQQAKIDELRNKIAESGLSQPLAARIEGALLEIISRGLEEDNFDEAMTGLLKKLNQMKAEFERPKLVEELHSEQVA